MPSRKFSKLSANNTMFSVILIVNAFVWLFCASEILSMIVNALSSDEAIMIWIVNFCGGVISIISGVFLVGRFHQRVQFFMFWIIFGTLSSIAPLFLNLGAIGGALVVSALFSISLGIGLPVSMAEFAEHTAVESRARHGGLTLLLIMVLGGVASSLLTQNIAVSLLLLAAWRGMGLTAFLFGSTEKKQERIGHNITFTSLLTQRSFLLYAIPWTVFCLVNYLGTPILADIHGLEFVNLTIIIENVLAGVFAIVGGFLSDIIGRRRITIVGFIMLGLGYAILGIYPSAMICWYFYAVVDGMAWGILYVIFITTIWGDLAHDGASEKSYALGSLPYLLSGFLSLTMGPFIAEAIPAYAIFSFAAFFLFLAVLPLMFAPETLPEKKMKERELKKYVEKAKEIREKFD